MLVVERGWVAVEMYVVVGTYDTKCCRKEGSSKW